MDDIIDLDDLTPRSATIKFNDQEIEIPPPKVGALLRAGNLSGKVKDAYDLSEEELDKAVDELTQQIYKMIPELKDKPLSLGQIQKIVAMFNDMSIPGEAKALQEEGISLDTSKKAQQG